ncbi:hypothetical protein QUA36_08655 [Microcoleus sp. Pol10D4]
MRLQIRLSTALSTINQTHTQTQDKMSHQGEEMNSQVTSNLEAIDPKLTVNPIAHSMTSLSTVEESVIE